MQINQITVSFTRTQSLPSYSNVKPSVTLTATLEPDESVLECCDVLMNDARRLVHGEIDDALEAVGESPKFTSEPLFSVYTSHLRKVTVIVPSSISRSDLEELRQTDPNGEHYRYRGDWATEVSKQRLKTIDSMFWAGMVIDCSDGVLSRIPTLPEPVPAEAQEPEYEPVDYSDLPDDNCFDEEE